MMSAVLIASLLFPLTSASGCYDDGDGRFNGRIEEYMNRQNEGNMRLHRRAQEGTFSPEVSNSKFRDLEWGDLNVIHMTDSHGWLAGHLNDQDDYSADWGDFISFGEHMLAEAERRGVDLLFVETGDRHDGTGLSDATSVDAALSNPILAQQPWDIVGIGNHELYHNSVIDQEYNTVRPFYNESYLSGNVEVLHDDDWVDAGNKYRIIETKNKKFRILAFSFLYNFKGNANHSRVTFVQNSVKEDWFKDAVLNNNYDIIFVTGHIPVRYFKEMHIIVDAIRQLKPDAIIQGFGGHSHVRDFRKFDDKAVALESGRYMENIGWASLNVTSLNGTHLNGTDIQNNPGDDTEVSYFRRYIDFNPENLAHHANANISTNFTTPRGAAVSQQIAQTSAELSLNTTYGYVDQDYQTNWAKFDSDDSLFKLLTDKVHPLLKSNQTTEDGTNRASLPRIIFCNTGNYRYPLLKGTFTKNQKYIVSPFSDPWVYAADVPRDIALSVLDELNNEYKYIKRDISDAVAALEDEEEFADASPTDSSPIDLTPPIMKRATATVSDVTTEDATGHPTTIKEYEASTTVDTSTAVTTISDCFSSAPSATATYIPPLREESSNIGYVTHDDYGDDGDDVIHTPYKVYKLPNAFQTKQNIKDDTEHIDLVFNTFLAEDIVPYIKKRGWNGKVTGYVEGYDRDNIADYFKLKSSQDN